MNINSTFIRESPGTQWRNMKKGEALIYLTSEITECSAGLIFAIVMEIWKEVKIT
ncbi:MAG: hypothetical protein NUV76_00065 [Candidatus Kuenenia sp.]|nr:hypothetical protein [Candidatus Kuenenia sp.]